MNNKIIKCSKIGESIASQQISVTSTLGNYTNTHESVNDLKILCKLQACGCCGGYEAGVANGQWPRMPPVVGHQTLHKARMPP